MGVVHVTVDPPPFISAWELHILHDPMPLMPLLTFACPTESLGTAQALVYTLAYWNFRVYSVNVFWEIS